MIFNLNTRNARCLKETGLWPAFNHIFSISDDEEKQEKINESTDEEFNIILRELIKIREQINLGILKL